MLDRFDTWQYRDDANCWDYVREYLTERYSIPGSDVPKYGICPDDKKSMHAASVNVIKAFSVTPPKDGSIAAQYIGNTIVHVGIVENGYVRHTGRKVGTKKNKIKVFESTASKTVYYTHKSLINGNG